MSSTWSSRPLISISPFKNGQLQGWLGGKFAQRESPALSRILQISYSQLPTPSRQGTVIGNGVIFWRLSCTIRSVGRSSLIRVTVFIVVEPGIHNSSSIAPLTRTKGSSSCPSHCFTEKSIGLLFPKSNFNGNMLPYDADIHKTNIDVTGFILIIDKLGSRSKVYLKSLIRDLDLELVTIIACLHPPTHQTFLSTITLKSLHV